MFRFLKYLFVMNRLRHAKRALVMLVASTALLMLFGFIAYDLSSHVPAEHQYTWMAVKWGVIVLLITVMGWSAKKVFILFTAPFGINQAKHDDAKRHVLTKTHLRSKEEHILEKYRTKAMS
jgi:hypothetical protein